MTAALAAAGQIVGGYRLIASLGSGGMGSVWLAEHTVLGRSVAIKLLLPSLSQQPEMIERFFAEARAATRIADPGIVTVHDFGWHTDGQAYLVMEHLVGETLAERLEVRGRMPVDEAIRITRLAALAMAAAHAASIVHRDLKPDNIFIVSDPAVPGGERVKILDFGIAKLLGEGVRDAVRTQTGAILGTPMYISPEQCRSAGGVDHRTDVYSLGGVLFHLVTGEPPFDGASAADLIASHLLEAPRSAHDLVPDVPPALDAIARRCLAKRADERYPSMLDLVHALDELTTEPPRPSRSHTARPMAAAPDVALLSTLASAAVEVGPVPRRSAVRWLIVLGVVVAAIAFAIATWAHDRSPTREPGPAIAPAVDAAPIDAGAIDAMPIDATPLDAPIDAPPRIDARPRYDPYAKR